MHVKTWEEELPLPLVFFLLQREWRGRRGRAGGGTTRPADTTNARFLSQGLCQALVQSPMNHVGVCKARAGLVSEDSRASA